MMKRLIAFLLACLMLVTLTACKKDAADSQPQDAEQPIAEEAQQPEEGEATEATEAAPEVKDFTSLEELNNEVGAKLSTPSGYTIGDESMQLVNENDMNIAQYFFVADDIPCGLRFSAIVSTDISGAFKEDGSSLFSEDDYDLTVDFEGSVVTRFVTVDGQYILVTGSDDQTFHDEMLSKIREVATKEPMEE